MLTSDWTCRACGTKVSAKSEVCAGCGVRAFAHGAELEAGAMGRAEMPTQAVAEIVDARQVSETNDLSSPRVILGPEAEAPVRAFLKSHPMLRKAITVLLYILAGCGATVFWVTQDIVYIGLGLAVLAVAISLGFVLGIELSFEKQKRESSK